jgi:transposase
LSSLLKLYFPLILQRLGQNLHSELVLDLLARWPTLKDLQRAHPKSLRAFLAEHGLRQEQKQTELLQAIRAATPLTQDEAVIGPHALYVQSLARQLTELNQAIDQFDEELRQAVAQHADAPIFQALPGAGDALVPRLIAAFGSDRARYESAEDLQTQSGIAPVTKRSGQSWLIVRRQACPKFLRQTFHEFANCARQWSSWSQAFYAMKRAGGMKHHAAVRALAFKWIRLLFRLWKTRTIYSETDYIQHLKQKHSPVIKFLTDTSC